MLAYLPFIFGRLGEKKKLTVCVTATLLCHLLLFCNKKVYSVLLLLYTHLLAPS
jgi:hypothetical protein